MVDPAITRFPNPIAKNAFTLTSEEKIRQMQPHIRAMLTILGLDMEDPSLAKTPEKYARMLVDEIFSGLDPALFPEINFESVSFEKNEMTILKNIALTSFCEHHLVPMMGFCHIAYIPKKRLLGLSKINKIVRYFAKRPQLQERLTSQIGDSLSLILETEDVAVMTVLTHCCVIARGVEGESCKAQMHVLKGVFQTDPQKHLEFFSSIGQMKNLGGL